MHIPYEEGHVDQDCSKVTRISFQIQQEVEIRCHFSRVKNRITDSLTHSVIRRRFLQRHCSWETRSSEAPEEEPERNRGQMDLWNASCGSQGRKERSWRRTPKRKTAQESLTQSLCCSSCGSTSLFLRNLPWILSDGCCVQMNRHQQFGLWKKSLMNQWPSIFKIKRRMQWMYQEQETNTLRQQRWTDQTRRERQREKGQLDQQEAISLEVLSLIEETFQQLLIDRTNRQLWFKGTLTIKCSRTERRPKELNVRHQKESESRF